MALTDELRSAIISGRLPAIFNRSDMQKAEISDPNDNLSNYDKKNRGSKNKKVLVSTVISDTVYYTFDEQLFP